MAKQQKKEYTVTIYVTGVGDRLLWGKLKRKGGTEEECTVVKNDYVAGVGRGDVIRMNAIFLRQEDGSIRLMPTSNCERVERRQHSGRGSADNKTDAQKSASKTVIGENEHSTVVSEVNDSAKVEGVRHTDTGRAGDVVSGEVAEKMEKILGLLDRLDRIVANLSAEIASLRQQVEEYADVVRFARGGELPDTGEEEHLEGVTYEDVEGSPGF